MDYNNSIIANLSNAMHHLKFIFLNLYCDFRLLPDKDDKKNSLHTKYHSHLKKQIDMPPQTIKPTIITIVSHSESIGRPRKAAFRRLFRKGKNWKELKRSRGANR